MAAVAPIKVDAETDELVTQAAHFLGRPKKYIVDAAVREYIDNHRAEIQIGVKDALSRLDGSKSAAVSALTGFSSADLDDLGGFSR
ncbi:hypothetical protein [Mycobacterium bourgelatii]|uniref:Uncharacterized protein n=1 Tax=Mycobacterium bourgelatii TaxID=1273442 RepID=A0A7I9YSV8_MYCBU|nr:hypothetical protein [Mycobacterium bourgelatii]MCV6976816.1 hypothetical protein [Mycobacterium bourgelatii]GFG91623.1 hypothetical protein MBOU_36650 [Mycobacterium bourgelatii]